MPILHRNPLRLPPSEDVQALFPIETFPCGICAQDYLPGLINNDYELYWAHQHGRGGRSGCPRFGKSTGLGAWVRLGSVDPEVVVSERARRALDLRRV